MKILLLSRSVPFPPDNGAKVKTYHLLRHLAAHHEVTLVSFVCTPHDTAGLDQLRPLCAAIYTIPLARSRRHKVSALIRSIVSGQPFIIERDASRRMARLVEQLVFEAATSGKPFDLVHADQLQMAQYAVNLPIPRLLDAHHAAWAMYARLAPTQGLFRRWLYGREAVLLRNYEAAMCSAFEAVTIVSEADRRNLLEILPHPREFTLIPIGIDTESVQPVQRHPAACAVLSLSAMHWPPNLDGVLWFARSIYPMVRRAAPTTSLLIIGAYEDRAVAELARLDPGIYVSGYVHDPAAFIAGAACMIVPLRSGGGMRIQILEALARGIPVVSTTAGYKGLELRPGEHLLVADTPSEFADAVSLLIRDPELGERIAEAGRRRVMERYDWRRLYPAIESVYTRMVQKPAPGIDSWAEREPCRELPATARTAET